MEYAVGGAPRPDSFDAVLVLECPSLDRTGLDEHLAQLPQRFSGHFAGGDQAFEVCERVPVEIRERGGQADHDQPVAQGPAQDRGIKPGREGVKRLAGQHHRVPGQKRQDPTNGPEQPRHGPDDPGYRPGKAAGGPPVVKAALGYDITKDLWEDGYLVRIGARGERFKTLDQVLDHCLSVSGLFVGPACIAEVLDSLPNSSAR